MAYALQTCNGMRTTRTHGMTEWIFKQLYSNKCVELLDRDPFILSSGGIFIPRVDRRKHHQYVLLSAKQEQTVKVIADELRNPLFEIIAKETMN